jgi:hypothetical protein
MLLYNQLPNSIYIKNILNLFNLAPVKVIVMSSATIESVGQYSSQPWSYSFPLKLWHKNIWDLYDLTSYRLSIDCHLSITVIVSVDCYINNLIFLSLYVSMKVLNNLVFVIQGEIISKCESKAFFWIAWTQQTNVRIWKTMLSTVIVALCPDTLEMRYRC